MRPWVSVGVGDNSSGSANQQNLDVSLVRVWIDDPPGGGVIGDSQAILIGGDSQSQPLSIPDNYDANSNLGLWYRLGGTGESPPPGTLMVFATTTDRTQIVPSSRAYERGVVGVVTENPYLLIGSRTGETPIAFSGRANVLVSGEGGAITPGDYLTSSSIHGYVMRAAKAGPVIGRAVITFNATTTTGEFDRGASGSIAMVIENGYWNGESLEDVVQGLAPESHDPLAKVLLNHFLADQTAQTLITSGAISEIFTDRIAAGLEIITPKVTTASLTTNAIDTFSGKDLTLTLSDDGKFVIAGAVATSSGSGTTTPVAVSFDSLGNAFFAGAVTADRINVNQINGLDVLTSQVSNLADEIQNLSLTGHHLTIANLLVSDGLSVTGPAIFEGLTTFASTTEFLANTDFKNGFTAATSTFNAEATFATTTRFAGDLTVQNGQIVVKDPSGATITVTIDSAGNASFGGDLNAARLYIAGQVIAGQIDSPTIDAIQGTLSGLATTTSDLIARVERLETQIGQGGGININDALSLNGALTVQSLTTLNGGLRVDSIGSVSNALTFLNDLIFIGRPYFNSDTAGFAVVRAGERRVTVTFDQEYLDQPVVNTTISLDQIQDPVARTALEESIFSNNIRYLITEKTTLGFTILLSQAAPADIGFSWIALAVKNAKTFTAPLNASAPPVPPPSPLEPPTTSLPITTLPPTDQTASSTTTIAPPVTPTPADSGTTTTDATTTPPAPTDTTLTSTATDTTPSIGP